MEMLTGPFHGHWGNHLLYPLKVLEMRVKPPLMSQQCSGVTGGGVKWGKLTPPPLTTPTPENLDLPIRKTANVIASQQYSQHALIISGQIPQEYQNLWQCQ